MLDECYQTGLIVSPLAEYSVLSHSNPIKLGVDNQSIELQDVISNGQRYYFFRNSSFLPICVADLKQWLNGGQYETFLISPDTERLMDEKNLIISVGEPQIDCSNIYLLLHDLGVPYLYYVKNKKLFNALIETSRRRPFHNNLIPNGKGLKINSLEVDEDLYFACINGIPYCSPFIVCKSDLPGMWSITSTDYSGLSIYDLNSGRSSVLRKGSFRMFEAKDKIAIPNGFGNTLKIEISGGNIQFTF